MFEEPWKDYHYNFIGNDGFDRYLFITLTQTTISKIFNQQSSITFSFKPYQHQFPFSRLTPNRIGIKEKKEQNRIGKGTDRKQRQRKR
ncbi:hypothetical protein MTR_3g448490 [Medicago truncatula]|uniref:Uncharacterized protein n=1 Tax=Medicago truncatula TaxID=3880 RepID=A0A072UUS2_MEDTR|nr:hypothetical protein MTR_3g448490 [Medicago truncatula]